MEFWGVEVKAGQPLKVNPEEGKVIHISQAALGEGKKEKGNDLIPLHVKINGKKFIVGSLSVEKFPQVAFDLVFEKEFELSHDWKNGSIYFCGYSAESQFPEEDDDFGSDDDEGFPTGISENGDIQFKGEEAKAVTTKGKVAKSESSAKPKVTVVEPKKDEIDDESDGESDDGDEDEDDSDDEDDDSDDEDIVDAAAIPTDEDDSEGEDDSDDEDEKKVKKAGPSKKRPTESAIKTPLAAKKPKLDTPLKTDGKKVGGHTATPHPSKQVGKAPADGNNSKGKKTPKSGGSIPCKSCPRTFVSDSALQSHSKAKHGSN